MRLGGTTGTEHNESQKTTSLNVINCLFGVKRSSRWHEQNSYLYFNSKTLELISCVGNEQWNRTRSVVIYA